MDMQLGQRLRLHAWWHPCGVVWDAVNVPAAAEQCH